MSQGQPVMTSEEIDEACKELGAATVWKLIADPRVDTPHSAKAMRDLVARVDANMDRLKEAARERILKALAAAGDE